jgi:hypothetical protein
VLREQKFDDAYTEWAKDLRARAYVEMRERRSDWPAWRRTDEPAVKHIARKRFGQHFLVDDAIIDGITDLRSTRSRVRR